MRIGSGTPSAVGRLAVLVAAVALVAAGCGSGPTFTAGELIDEMNERGAELALGEQLGDAEAGAEIHALAFTGEADPEDHADGAEPEAEDHAHDAGPEAGGHAHAGGSLLIAADDDAALADYRRCEQAVSLICYRAGNAVLMFEDEVPRSDLDRVRDAITAMGAE